MGPKFPKENMNWFIYEKTCCEEHVATAASENMLMKLRKMKIDSKGILILH